MATQEQRDATADVALQVSQLLSEAAQTHGMLIALGGAVSAIGALVGTLDRDPSARALAAWQRAFTVTYDAALYGPELRSAGEA